MPKYLIERSVPNAGDLTTGELKSISEQLNRVLRELGPDIQWVQSVVTDERIYDTCISASVDLINEHARLAGFPAERVMEVKATIDPTTAEM